MSVFSLLCLWSLLLVCSVNMLYMELSYTGSLNWSKSTGHVTVQIAVLQFGAVKLRLDIIHF